MKKLLLVSILFVTCISHIHGQVKERPQSAQDTLSPPAKEHPEKTDNLPKSEPLGKPDERPKPMESASGISTQNHSDLKENPKEQAVSKPTSNQSNDQLQIGNAQTSASNSKMTTAALTRPQLIRALTEAKYMPDFIITASHRAQYNGGLEPENSQDGIEAVVSGNRADIVELDIKKSSDGEVYVMHDDYLQRTTDFLDKFPGVGGSSADQKKYGNYDYYTWDQVSTLTLRNADFEYTDRKVPKFRDVLRYFKNSTSSLINLDIGDMNVFRATWDIVKEEDAFDCVIFKTASINPLDYSNQYYNPLPAEMKSKVIFFPMIGMANPGHTGDPMGAYNEWENSSPPLAKGYELGYRKNADAPKLLDVVTQIRIKGTVRVHVFNTYPDNYKGRYMGNVNVNQCCNDGDDSRGDWNYLLDPRGFNNYTRGANGYIITDDPETLATYLSLIGKRSTN
ncbi:glycerophosphodiester phosphodiesterase family protein [Chryseobacterium sp. JUb7]|uniref:glycerophosphodiester phosphodiesterase family protein n=1 Tax=Chryseobacterium sp. JUb7 TaxID=2940599 RepID=UPI002169B826|nr:glycerophosphodiester phosphodiesterase family protein [Chryseobacterium sp. JUb7]MCS3529526.1 glycerophosphoryl diester phosphodiesterase [Chryseobacterium sp. JUb7]